MVSAATEDAESTSHAQVRIRTDFASFSRVWQDEVLQDRPDQTFALRVATKL